MAVSVINPIDGRVVDANGNPIVGAKRYVYNANTTTLRACFTDDDLTISAANPQISIADGTFPRVFTAPGTYKIRQETSAGVLIPPEVDDIDSGLSAGTVALGIDKGGTGATTAAAARANLDVPSNSELAAVSAEVAAFTASLTNIVSNPQGRLTPTSNTPIITTGVTSGTAVYYTPYTGNLCPIYDGAQFNLREFAELTLTLNSNYVLNSIYDVFVINDSVAGMTLVSGPAWTTITAGSGARGTGAGTTELTRLKGLLVNANAMATARNGATTYAVAASQGTYVGSIYIDGVAGQITCNMAYGQSRKFGIWNYYNRAPIILRAGDATASWTYTTNTYRPSNNATANSITLFTGAAEEVFDCAFSQTVQANGSGTAQVGIGFNSTSSASGKSGPIALTSNGNNYTVNARLISPPSLGINVVTSLEKAPNPAATNTWAGTEDGCQLTAVWRG